MAALGGISGNMLMYVKEMARQECLDVLCSCRQGRLACSKDNQPYIVPINCTFADNHLYEFSLVGQKIEWMRANPLVCVQIDHFMRPREWRSVVVYGRYEELSDAQLWQSEQFHAWSLLKAHANWWEPGSLKPGSPPAASPATRLFFRITIERLTGRQSFIDDETQDASARRDRS